ncbi:CDP-diacylglycerol--serine O-phosphatidyltransferase [Helicobacter monodelphidis]|uniref:CDP-diacylglycerol--serine O-phosphatidyltransferase n=1 Tax=Helicobacter sp. 15-1451 TaxID=2004995 RepID=UPI000DCD2D0D|nr:CDP-diacylglycerol--serine O-phosphatidyltransferase [Helicobacter sp. 15-1451]RAX57253.1 CDP-diacylglycerol--serine O-phosphatidyltransferase [Helicobacter sp. 15-1451]
MNPINPLYILPNLFTGISAFLGMLSIAYASSQRFEAACWLVLVALIFDGLDGRVARLTGTTSKFGVEFDSLADVIAFGAAPATLLYIYVGSSFERFGFIVSGLFVVFGAVRLARFNVSTGNNEPNVFIGLPIPSAATFVVIWILMDIYYNDYLPNFFGVLLLICALLTAILMVSNIRYPSFKNLTKNGISMRGLIILLILVLAILYLYATLGIAVLITSYILFGILRACYYLIVHRLLRKGL